MKQPEYRGGVNGRRGGGGSHEFLRSPWVKHYKPSPKIEILVENQVVSSSGKKGIVVCSSGVLREGCSHSRDRDQISIGQGIIVF